MNTRIDTDKVKNNTEKEFFQIFHELYHQYKKIYFSYILKLTRNYHTAEDLLQESFIKIAKKFSTLKDIKKFRSWGFQIVANTCRDWYKKVQREKTVYVENIEEYEDKLEIIKEDTPVKEIMKVINKILNTLEYDEREVFLLKQYERMNYKEIGDTLNLSQRTVRRRMKSSLVKLISELERMRFVVGENFNIEGK